MKTNKIINYGKEIANKFNKYFTNIIKKLNLKKDTGTSFQSQENYRMIKVKFGNENFSFEIFTKDTVVFSDISDADKNLPTGKASASIQFRVQFLL